MSDSVVRLKVESQEYDAKLKRAVEGLQRYADGCRKVGGTLEFVEKETLDYVKAIGQMETHTRTATGKLTEMKKAFVEFSAVYREMTDAERQSPIGKALSQSLDQLKGRIEESKKQLGEINKELGETANDGKSASSAIEALTSQLGINTKTLLGWGAAIAAGKIALDVAKDAFFASEANVDEWGRIVASSQSVYEGFLSAINNGDIGGYLSRIDEIVSAARTAYNELDRLGTMRTIQTPAMSKQEAENNRIRMMLMTGRYIAPVDGRKATMAGGTLLSPEQIRRLEEQLQSGMKTIVSLTKNELDQTGKAIDAYYNKLAVQSGMSLSEFRRGTSSMAEFDKRVQGAMKYDEWQVANSYVDQGTGRLIAPRTGNPYAQYAGWNNFRVDKQGQNSYNDLVNLIKQQQQQTSQLYTTMGQSYRTINRAETRIGGDGGRNVTTEKFVEGGIKGIEYFGVASIQTTESMLELQDQLSRYRNALANATNLIDAGAAQAGIDMTQRRIGAQSMALRLGIDTDSMIEIQDEVKAWGEELIKNIPPIEITTTGSLTKASKEGLDTAKAWQSAANAVNSVGSALNGLEDPGAKVAGIVGQAIANIALGFATASTQAAAAGPFAWIAAIAGGLATMVSTISSIKSATAGSYAEGGIVPGNNHNDGLMAAVSSGELILNKAQQSNLAKELSGPAYDSAAQPRIMLTGDKLFVAINNYLKATNKGQLVTSK